MRHGVRPIETLSCLKARFPLSRIRMEEHSIMEEYIVKLIVWALADGLNLKIR